MANFLRSLAGQSVRCRLGLLPVAIAAVSLAVASTPAGAVVAGGGEFGETLRAAPSIVQAPLQYHGGPVLHSSVSYVIYWDPIGSYNSEWKQLINGYVQGVGVEKGTLNNPFALNGQYRDSSGRAANEAIYRGSYTDEHAYPSEPCGAPAEVTCLTDAQIRTELQSLINSGNLPGATGTPVYYVLTPPGVTVCDGAGGCSVSTATPDNGICGYHSVIDPEGPGQTIYAVQPWVAGNAGSVISPSEPTVTRAATSDVLACQDNRGLDEPNQLASHNIFGEWTTGLADVIVNNLAVEQSNVVTNPLLNGWYQSATKAEQSDMCQWSFGPPPVKPPSIPEEQVPAHAQIVANETVNGRSYYLQFGFDSVGVTAGRGITCWSGVALDAHYTAPNPVNSGDVVAFDATESTITLNAHTQGLPADEPYVAPVYSWNFGDGSTATGTDAASQFHSYTYGGSYAVALTVTDSSGNSATVTKSITVVGPPAPSAAGGAGTTTPAGGSGSASGAPAGTTAGAPAGGSTAKPKPVVAMSAVSRTLRSVKRSGLVVRYSVSEQVAGHFELLLASSVARKLGLRGAPATGLAPGSPPQIVIGKAILVTTKGGRSTISIQLAKKTEARLARLRHVSLLLRLVVRNAANQSVTALGTVTLSR